MLIATVLLGAVALAWPRARREIAELSGRDWLALSGVGLVLAVHFATWITSLELTSVAASVVLVTLHPAFVGVVSGKLFGEPLPATGWLGVMVAIVGGGIIAFGDSRAGPMPLVGDALALVGALAAASYFLAGRNFRQRLSLLAYVVPVYAASTVSLFVMVVVSGAPLAGYSGTTYAYFAALAIVPMILGHTLLNFALKHVTAPVIATAILGEPVGSTLLALWILAETPPAWTLLGGALVLAGIGAVVIADARARRRLNAPTDVA